jgi:hypothetical protein
MGKVISAHAVVSMTGSMAARCSDGTKKEEPPGG